MTTLKLDTDTFANDIFGDNINNFPKKTLQLINKYDFSYTKIDDFEKEKLINDIQKKINKDSQKIGSKDRTEVWNKGWNENLELFKKTLSIDTILPKFIRQSNYVRLFGDFVKPYDIKFEQNFVSVIQSYVFEKYLVNFENLYEFGCGSGLNLVPLAKRFPKKNIYGSDFVPSSVDLIKLLAQTYDLNIKSTLFNLIEPDFNYIIKDSSAIFTFGALEQIASKFEKFIDFILYKKPDICIHVEPSIEMYDEYNQVDKLAIDFHRKRGYTEGYIPKLLELDDKKLVNLIKVKRLNFGSLMFEGYTLIVWTPKV